MSDDVKPITVTILDKEYIVGCAENEREALFATVEFLNGKMEEQRDSGKVIGAERIAVMAAINIAHDMLKSQNQVQNIDMDVITRLDDLQAKIHDSLEKITD